MLANRDFLVFRSVSKTSFTLDFSATHPSLYHPLYVFASICRVQMHTFSQHGDPSRRDSAAAKRESRGTWPRRKKNVFSGCALHCTAPADAGLLHLITRDERAYIRGQAERTNGRNRRQYNARNGMEWNGIAGAACYKISAFTISAEAQRATTMTTRTELTTTMVTISLAVVVIIRRHP